MKKNKKIIYIGLLLVLFLVSIFGKSYSFFTSKYEQHGKLNVVTGMLDYKLKSIDLDSNNRITLLPREAKMLEIEITSLNDIVSRYELFYVTNSDDIKIGYSKDTENGPTGEIGIKETKKVMVVIKNRSESNVTVTFGVQGGFSHNDLVLDSGKNSMNKELQLCKYNPGDVVKDAGYTGSADLFQVPCDGNYKIELWGAEGYKAYGGAGGAGGYVSGNIDLKEADTFYLYVGNQGTYTTNAWNGGGICHKNSGSNCGSSGGGGVDIRKVNGSWDNAASLRSRIMVAGSGGGAGGSSQSTTYYSTPGAGGGLTGYAAAAYQSYATSTGGNQTLGGNNQHSTTSYITDTYGAFGMAPQTDNNVCCGAGGGSGWYGGGGGCGTSAGGGSAYISGHTGCVAVTSKESSSPKSGCTTSTTNNTCSISPYEYVFYDTKMIDGLGYSWTNVKGSLEQMPNPNGGYYASGKGHTGNGHAKITYLGNDNYIVTFNSNGGNSIESKTVLSGNSIGQLPTPVKSTELFSGWYLEDTFTTRVTNDYVPTDNITLYAKYTVCSYAIGDVVKSAGYTGKADSFVAPCTGNYKIELWGGSGTGAAYGGYTSGNIELSKDKKLYIYVGDKASTTGNTTVFNSGTGSSGGYNGGGATDIRFFSSEPTSTMLNWNNATGLNSRIMVAGGGGSASSGTAGAGGGLTGYSGGGTNPGTQTSYGAVQSSNYTASSFGIANGGCSGGNGYYPGGGAACASGAGGGSSYISGHTGCVAIKEGSTSATRAVNISGCTMGTTNTECSKHYSGLIFTSTKMIDGKGYSWTNVKGSLEQMPNPNGGYYANGVGHSSSGYVRITYIGA